MKGFAFRPALERLHIYRAERWSLLHALLYGLLFIAGAVLIAMAINHRLHPSIAIPAAILALPGLVLMGWTNRWHHLPEEWCYRWLHGRLDSVERHHHQRQKLLLAAREWLSSPVGYAALVLVNAAALLTLGWLGVMMRGLNNSFPFPIIQYVYYEDFGVVCILFAAIASFVLGTHTGLWVANRRLTALATMFTLR